MNPTVILYTNCIVFNKLCMPDLNTLPAEFQDQYNNVIGDIGIDDVAQAIEDLITCWPVYLTAFGVCFLIT
jgi:hypothetical protein